MRLHCPEHRVYGAWRSPLSRESSSPCELRVAGAASPTAGVGSDSDVRLIAGLACVLAAQVGVCSGPFCPRRGAHPPSLPPQHREVSALQNKSCSSPSLSPAPSLGSSLPPLLETRSGAALGPRWMSRLLSLPNFVSGASVHCHLMPVGSDPALLSPRLCITPTFLQGIA